MGCCFLVVLVVFFRPYCFAFAVFVRGAACLAEMGSLPSGCNYQSQNSVFFIFSGFFFFFLLLGTLYTSALGNGY